MVLLNYKLCGKMEKTKKEQGYGVFTASLFLSECKE